MIIMDEKKKSSSSEIGEEIGFLGFLPNQRCKGAAIIGTSQGSFFFVFLLAIVGDVGEEDSERRLHGKGEVG